MNNFRRIETLNFDVSNPETLKIEITERVPLYTWCGEVLDLKNKCEFVDKDGYVFDEAPYFSGDIYFRFYGKLSDYYINQEYFKNLVLFISNLDRTELLPVALIEKEDDELEIYLSSNNLNINSPKIILNYKGDLEKLFQNLKSAIETDPLKTKIKENYTKLKYLDLRFSNKVYYKFDE
jgi:cell division septal protein FtsQ